jgi:serine/threonine protein kinase
MNGGGDGAAAGRNLTGETGTYRWMAPEVIRHEAYSSSADVYSFAIMVWQFLTHEDPFLDVPSTEAARLVAFEQQRPPLPKKTPQALVDLIQANWSDQPSERWDFEKVTATLQQIQETGITAEEKTWLEASYGHPVYSCEEEEEVEDEIATEQKQQKGAFRRQPKLKVPDTNGPKRGGSRLSNFFGVHKKIGKKQ